MAHNAEIFGSAIVILGSLNPAIFTPDWLERHNLLGAQDADVARQTSSYIVSNKISALETDWCSVQVFENQFTLNSKGALTPAVKDLAVGILSLIPHTPITALGLNFMGHYKMATVDDYHKVGDVFAPKKIWHEMFPRDDNSVGLIDLTVRVWHAPDRKISEDSNQQNISIQPSTRVKNGIYVSFNDHYDIRIEEGASETTAERAANIIEERWQASWQTSTNLFDGLISKALEGRVE